jgi:Leucine-rich repeat (LRR) protein
MKKIQQIPDDVDYQTKQYMGEDGHLHHFRIFVTVGGKEIDAEIRWLSQLAKDATLREALELYPANPALVENGSGWAANHLDTTAWGYYTGVGGDRPMHIKLNLHGLGIRSIGDVKGLDTIPRIDELDLSDNQFNDVSSLAQMPWRDTLQVLSLSGNHITSFPTTAFPMIQELYLSSNNIDSIGTIGPSNSMENLELSENELTAITRTDLAKFSNLIQLIVTNNKITKIGDITGLTGAWRNKPPIGLRARRSISSRVVFVFAFHSNPIKIIHPKTLIFMKESMKEGTLQISCDDAVQAMIEKA